MRFCMCAYLRSIACLHARILHPSISSTHGFAACHAWATSADALVPTYRHTRVKVDESFVQSQGKALERRDRKKTAQKWFANETSHKYIPSLI
ncbi:hypothetical protein V8C34DRAFT_272178 [Trichoderma compactum]